MPWRTASGRFRHLPPYLSLAELEDRLQRPLSEFERLRSQHEQERHRRHPVPYRKPRQAVEPARGEQVTPGLLIYGATERPEPTVAGILDGMLGQLQRGVS